MTLSQLRTLTTRLLQEPHSPPVQTFAKNLLETIQARDACWALVLAHRAEARAFQRQGGLMRHGARMSTGLREARVHARKTLAHEIGAEAAQQLNAAMSCLYTQTHLHDVRFIAHKLLPYLRLETADRAWLIELAGALQDPDAAKATLTPVVRDLYTYSPEQVSQILLWRLLNDARGV